MSTSCLFSVTCFWGEASSEPREDNDVDEGDDLKLSRGEMVVEEAGVESVVVVRRRAASEGKAVVVMVVFEVGRRTELSEG